MKSVTASLAAALVIAGVAAGCGGSGGSSGGGASGSGGGKINLKIGFSGGLSGSYAAYDQPELNGMEFAAKQINAAGGPVTVDVSGHDNKGDPSLTVSTTQDLLDNGYKLQVIGTGDGRTAAGQLVSQSGGVALAGLNTYPTFPSDIGPRAVTVTLPDNAQAAAQGEYACKQGYKSAYLLAAKGNPYTENLPKYFAEAFAKKCGGRVVGQDVYSVGQSDFGSEVTRLKNASPAPDVVYTPMFVPDSNTFLKQLRQAGVSTPYLSSDANYIPAFLQSAGSAGNGVVISSYAFDNPGSPLAKFDKAYTQVMGKRPETTVYEAVGRDQVYALVEAAKEAKSADPSAVLAKLTHLKGIRLVALGKTSVNPSTRLPQTADVPEIKVVDGTFKLATTITPDYIPPPIR